MKTLQAADTEWCCKHYNPADLLLGHDTPTSEKFEASNALVVAAPADADILGVMQETKDKMDKASTANS